MKILFVRPPRTFWPFNSESSSFWQPLAFASIAAVLRDNLNVDVKILDCLPLKIGWKSLRKYIEREKPDIICLGDETASSNEGIKVIKLVKDINSEITLVGGGYFFGNMIEESLILYGLDFVVLKEGEYTMLELVKELISGEGNFVKIKGIAYLRNGEVVKTPAREFIFNLDQLPFPAYDLLPMELYGPKSKNHKDFVAIEHGRGCTASCSFCSIWLQMSNNKYANYRTKSAKRSLEETEWLITKYKRKTFNWVDGTWNADPKWSKEYCEGVKERGWDIQHTAWMRADFVIRDEKAGIVKKQVDAGLVESIIGAERPPNYDLELKGLNKINYSFEKSKQAFEILKKYKKVYTIASFIYGLPDDDRKVLKGLYDVAQTDFADMMFFLPFTPNPGTVMWDRYKDQLGEPDFRKHNYHLPIMDTKYLTRQQLNRWFKFLLIRYIVWPDTLLKRVVFETDQRKRRLHVSLAKKVLYTASIKFLNLVTFRNVADVEEEYGRCPTWYYC